MHKVSVVVPVYNAQSYLPKCLDSIVNQTFSDIEIIIVNDQSTDDSLKICREYERNDDRIKIIDKKNEGVSKARNTGLGYASGEYVLFIDSDDFIESNMIESLYEEVISNNADMALCNYIIEINGEKKYIKSDIDKELVGIDKIKSNLILPLIERENGQKYHNLAGFRSPWGKIFKKNIIDKYNIRFKEDMAIGEDFLFNLEFLIRANKVVFNDDFYYHYVTNQNSALTKYKEDCWEKNYKKILINLKRFLNIHNMYSQSKDRMDKLAIKYFFICLYNEEKNPNFLKSTLVDNLKILCEDSILAHSIGNAKKSEYSLQNNIILFFSKHKLYNFIYIFQSIKKLKCSLKINYK